VQKQQPKDRGELSPGGGKYGQNIRCPPPLIHLLGTGVEVGLDSLAAMSGIRGMLRYLTMMC
jgi:hypothetical protein